MGYRSDVHLKTTSEGWVIIQKYNNSIAIPDDRPLRYAEVNKSPTGCYKISFTDVKWYESFKDVNNFMDMLPLLDEQDIPYSYIRLGEETNDIDYRTNWTKDMPDAIANFEPVVDINDDEAFEYEEVSWEEPPLDETHIKEVMFDLFDKYEEHDEIKEALRSLNSCGDVSDTEYDTALANWDAYLLEWESK